MTRENSRRSVSEAQAGNAETRNCAEVPGLTLVNGGILVGAMNQDQLFLERHLAQQFVYLGVAGYHRNILGGSDGRPRCKGCKSEHGALSCKPNLCHLQRIHVSPHALRNLGYEAVWLGSG